MKRCTKCKDDKSFDSFHRNRRNKDGYQERCKVCVLEARREYYRSEKGKQAIYKSGHVQRMKIRTWLFEYLASHPCETCGESDIRCLDFDHLDRAGKSFTIGGSGAIFKSLPLAQREVEKCRVLCANCHRKVTHEQDNSYKHQWVLASC